MPALNKEAAYKFNASYGGKGGVKAFVDIVQSRHGIIVLATSARILVSLVRPPSHVLKPWRVTLGNEEEYSNSDFAIM